jgi:hypothetical protein
MSHTSPLTLWRTLTPDLQEQIGALLLAAELSTQLADAHDDTVIPELAAASAAREEAQDLIAQHLPQAYMPTGEAQQVDLNTIGIRQCTSCGCTDKYACQTPTGTCHWVPAAAEPTCSNCLPPAQEA